MVSLDFNIHKFNGRIMSLDHLKSTLTQIGNLVKHLNKKNFTETSEQIDQLIEEFGLEADRNCLRCLFSAINFSDPTPNSTAQLQAKLLGAHLQKQLYRAVFVSNICFAIDQCFSNQKSLKPTTLLIGQISKVTGINKLCECTVSLALTHSTQSDLRKYARDNLKRTLPELIESYLGKNNAAAASVSGLHEISFNLLQFLLVSLDEYAVPQQLKIQFLQKLREEFPRESVPLILAPFLYRITPPVYNASKLSSVVRIGIAANESLLDEPGTVAVAQKDTNGEATASIEIGIEEIYDNLYDTIFTNQVKNNIMDTSWINLILEIGYEFTTNVDECKNHLRCSTRELQAQDVAKIIGLMCRRHSSLLDCNVNLPTPANFWPGQQSANSSGGGGAQQQQQNVANNNDNGNGELGSSSSVVDKKDKNGGGVGNSSTDTTQTWKPDIFVQAIKDIIPQLNWKEVCLELDHSEFIVKDRIGLDLLLTIFRLGTNSQLFPHPECIYRHWQNTDGQLSLVTTMLKNPDLFSFADYIYSAAPVEVLKTPPDLENKDICAWKSLHLVEVLLYIADQGYYAQVHDLFKFPAQNCPDVLFLSLLHINPPMTPLRQDLINLLIPNFLSNHPNSSAILASAWSSANFQLRPVIMHAMSEWYLRNGNEYDQVKLSRILDLAQDLKALSSLLNVRSFLFVIDLACLASRREYLKLEKWLTDKIREHGEPFIQAMIKVLQRRCPQVTNAKIPEDQLPPKQSQLLPETVSTMLTCLQSCLNSVPPEIADLIMQMTANCTILANKARAAVTAQQQGPLVPPQPPPPQSVMRGHRGMDMSSLVTSVPPPPTQQQPQFSANLSAQQMFGPNMDPLANMTTNIANLNLGGGPNGAFNFGNVLNNLVSTPASPSRLMNPAASPYPLNAIQMQAPPPPSVGNLGRMPPAVPQPTPTPPNPNNPIIADLQTPVSKEVEDEANSYFQRIYNHPPHPTLSIDEVLDILHRFKESNSRREQEVYLCMLRNLFEEYRFFSHYPEKELQITAQLFGGIIERNLVPTFVALGLSLRCVLDALRKPEGSKLYYFGITALDRFKNKLHTYNKYCEHIRSIPHFQDFPPQLIQYVEYGYLGEQPPNKVVMMSSGNNNSSNVQPPPPVDAIYRSNSVTG